MVAEVQSITPGSARALLAKNNRNRNLNERYVATFKRAMAGGEWRLNGESIKIAKDGTLLDGQHRLAAVAGLGEEASVPMLVVTGLDREDQETVDTGRKRRFGDMLHMRGEKHYANLAAVVTQLYAYERHGAIGISLSTPASTQELFDVLDRHPGLRDSVGVGKNLNRLLTPAAAGSLHYLFTATDEDDGEMFFEQLTHGHGLEVGDPIHTLREKLLRDLTGERRMHLLIKAAVTIKAFNAWRDGQQVQVLRYRPGGAQAEIFPVIDDCPIKAGEINHG